MIFFRQVLDLSLNFTWNDSLTLLDGSLEFLNETFSSFEIHSEFRDFSVQSVDFLQQNEDSEVPASQLNEMLLLWNSTKLSGGEMWLEFLNEGSVSSVLLFELCDFFHNVSGNILL